MPSASDTQVRRDRRGDANLLDQVMGWILFGALAGWALLIGDYSLIGVRIVSALLFLGAVTYLIAGWRKSLHISFAFVCPFLMFLYGLGQAAWSDQRILFNGLEKSLFWLTVAIVALLATQLFRHWQIAGHFRLAVALFGSFEALLSVLQQASHTDKYFWIFPSGFPTVFGTFAYYNNFSQLIELTLPITLWEGLRTRQVRFPFLLLAALQIGAVVSSGSRAGAVLVFVELIAVLFIAWLKNRETMSMTVLLLAFLLSAGFTYVAGFQVVLQKLQQSDQLANRRLLNQSSINMIKARPLTGWGLGAYVPVYKAFALYDDGTWVNQAHNDYLEWAAEGGIPYACLMLILIASTVRPAVRSVWGLGLLAVALHALVDYPFARLGTCGWYFALAAMVTAKVSEAPQRHRRRRLRTSQEDATAESAPEFTPQPLQNL
jgi:O-antigen ligase